MSENQKWNDFDLQDENASSGRKKWLPIIGAGFIVAFLGGAVVAFVNNISGTPPKNDPFIQQISIVQPPPPPPPPKIEQPEPEVEEIEIEEAEPEMADDMSDLDEALGEELGLDADGVAGGDEFGLLAKKGGRGLIGGDPHAWYGGVISRELQKAFSDIDEIRRGDYSVIVSIWLSEDGYIEDSELVRGTNNPELDDALRKALESGLRISRLPPEDLPQPATIRITSRT